MSSESTGYYRLATAEEQAAEGFTPAVITAGKIRIQGLDSGTYYLEETKAPANYNELRKPQEFKIEAEKKNNSTRELNGKATLTVDTKTGIASQATVEGETTYKEGGLAIINLSGVELPHTGGIGTTLFYVVGGVLVVGAGILLIVKKRMKDED